MSEWQQIDSKPTSMSSLSPSHGAVGRTGGTVARAVAAVLRGAGLTRPAFRTWERFRAARIRKLADYASDGLPLPPTFYIVQVVGPAGVNNFWSSGREAAREIRAMLARHDRPVDGLEAFLDFGCGCGRVLRHWADLRGPRVSATDYNPQLVRWVHDNLHFVDVRRNDLAPPLPHPDSAFDFVYAVSVFTHLSEGRQRAWLAELRRVLRPGGLLLFTTQGNAYAPALDRPGLRRLRDDFEANRLVVIEERVEGTNRCSAYHPHEWVKTEFLDGFDLVDYVPSFGEAFGFQDAYLVRPRPVRRKTIG